MASAASRAFRRALGAAARSAPGAAPKELYALKVDNNGRAWHRAVRIGQGDDGLLRHLLPRDAPLLERTGSFGDTPATLTARPAGRGDSMLIVRFQPFSAVIGADCAMLVDAHRASPKAAAVAIARAVSARDAAAAASGAGASAGPLAGAVPAAGTVAHADDAHAKLNESAIAVDDFPLRALECVLDEATGYYHQKLRRVKLLAEYCLDSITDELKVQGAQGEAGFQRLLPLRRAMTSLEADIKEAHHAIQDAMKSDERVDALLPKCSRTAYRPQSEEEARSVIANWSPYDRVGANDPDPAADPDRDPDPAADPGLRDADAAAAEADPRPPDARRRAAVMGLLQTHLWRIRAAGGELAEIAQSVESTREVWELYLDGVRNRTVRLNLQATIATLAMTVIAVPASLAGMNLTHGFEEASPAIFWGLTGGLACVSSTTWLAFMRTYWSPGGAAAKRADDLRALRFVLNRMDDLDDVMRAKGTGAGDGEGDEGDGYGGDVRSKDDLLRAISSCAGGAKRDGLISQAKTLDPAAMDLIFKVFDRDGDGRIDPSKEWVIRPWPIKRADDH